MAADLSSALDADNAYSNEGTGTSVPAECSTDHRPPQEQAESDWEDHRGYMHVKRRKLQNQFNDIVSKKQSSIFKGVTIYVNGWTDPTADELKHLIHAHGGNYVYNFYSSASVTHIIASNLPNSKIKNIGDKIVCTPNWIVESIVAGYCLPYQKYQLYSQHSSAQRRLGFTATIKTEPQAFTPSEPDNIEILNGKQTLKHQSGSTSNADTSTTSKLPITGVSSSSALKTQSYSSSRGAEFVSEFYTHSRLHHLSTWSTELKRFVAEMVTKVKPKHPILPPSVSLRAKKERCVVHIDLDCFFVSVSIRDKPHLKGKPVAVTHAKLSSKKGVCHSSEADLNSSKAVTSTEQVHPKHLLESMSDIASCSYEARDCGVRNGMLVGQALKKCPGLQLVSYDFDSYREVSQIFYETLLHYSSTVEAVSCDETYIELTDYVKNFENAEKIVRELRNDIHSKTNCTVSAGISHNMLLARMATRVAKPDGQVYVPLPEADKFVASHKVRDLPGVGYSLTAKLQELGIETCQDLKKIAVAKLKADFGSKTGQMLYQSARGLDDRPLKITTERKSVSVDMNFGIRLSDNSEAKSLIKNLADELEKRAEEASVLGGTISLKLKIRSQNAPQEAPKYLGHGQCDNVTRSVTLLQPTRTSSEVARLANRLLAQVNPAAGDIRGVGIQLTKLLSSDACGKDSVKSLGADLRKILSAAASKSEGSSPMTTVSTKLAELTGACAFAEQSTYYQTMPVHTNKGTDESFAIDLPPASQLDSSVLEALPLELKQKILEGYASKNDTQTRTIPPVVLKKQSVADSCNEVSSCSVMPSQTVPVDDVKPATSTAAAVNDGIVIENEETFLVECRQYIDEWVTNFIEGPNDEDMAKVSNFLLKLSKGNLEMLSLFLKHFRRVLSRLALSQWYPFFNTILDTVQGNVNILYGGILPIKKLC